MPADVRDAMHAMPGAKLSATPPASPSSLAKGGDALGLHEWGTSPLPVLHLNREILLDDAKKRAGYYGLHTFARLLPALVIYGGTFCLLLCALCQYRWGVLLSLTLLTFYMLHMCMAFLTFSSVGLVRLYLASSTNWYGRYCKAQGKSNLEEESLTLASGSSENEEHNIGWADVIHLVIIPCYKTPRTVLVDTLSALGQFSLARKNLGVVLAFEEREESAFMKASSIKSEFDSQFRFIIITLHPPSLPHHVPGKSSNECWAFFQVCRELEEEHGISKYDPSVVLTVLDDDSLVHANYFEALTCHFLTTDETVRYTSTWQPPVCHMRNYLRQPVLVRISSLFASLHELSCLANPLDCHINYSSYSLSLVLASTVGGWDPDFLAEDWHMFAKCSIMTEGRVRCRPIFLALLNYTPEEETYFGSMVSRWQQAKRHALGVSELVYVVSSSYLALLELRQPHRCMAFIWRIAPLTSKMAQVHFINGMSAVWNILAQFVIHFYMWRSWCYLSQATGTCAVASSLSSESGIAQDQILLNSWLVHWQQRAAGLMVVVCAASGGLGAFYFYQVKERVEGDLSRDYRFRHPLITWLIFQVEVTVFGLASSLLFGAAPLWIAVLRVIHSVHFPHVVAGMVGREPDAPAAL